MRKSTYIIAEAGVNHNGSMKLARKLVKKAAEIGADAIKFQSFKTEKIVIPDSPKANYQNISVPDAKTQFELLKSLELSRENFIELQALCQQYKIDFLSTPFDLESLDDLLSIGLETIKISSGDITFGPLLLKAAQSGKPVILSTGISNENDIQQALAVLSYGYLYPDKMPDRFSEILTAAESKEAKILLQKKVIVLHCTSEYPAPLEEVHLKAMAAIHDQFSVPVGYSDHTRGILVPSLAVALGAVVIEKHITLDNDLAGPDHKASLNVDDFSKMIEQIRLTEKVLGSARKVPTAAELQNKSIVRRGLYAQQIIQKGRTLSESDIIALRPSGKCSPMQYWDLLGKAAACDYQILDEI